MRTSWLAIMSIILHLSFAPVQGNSQTDDTAITWNSQKDMELLLPSGEALVVVMDHTALSRRQEIMLKARMALQERPEILQELYRLHELHINGERRDELFREIGFSRQEHEELEEILASTYPAPFIPAGTETIIITRRGERIHVEAGESLSFLNDLVIDPVNNVVMLGKSVLSTRDTIAASRLVDGQILTGYEWSYSHGLPEPGAGVAVENIDAEEYRVVLGYFDGRTYLEISVAEIRGGRIMRNYRVPMVIGN